MTIMVGIDLHVKTIVCEIGAGKDTPLKRTFKNTTLGRDSLFQQIEQSKEKYKTKSVLAAYEASGLGYILYDKFIGKGYQCAVLAPTEMKRSASDFKKKTDKKDAGYIYEIIRGHVLAGNQLHNIWIPDKELRDDRDIVRTDFDLGQKIVKVKVQIHALLKKNGIELIDSIENWSKGFFEWLDIVQKNESSGFSVNLSSLLRQLSFLQMERAVNEKELKLLTMKERYKKSCEALMGIPGVGLRTALTYLTEMGDLNRFNNRRQIGAYIGLIPSTNESGDASDRKGRITRNGPYRLRSILNQSFWAHLRLNGEERVVYDRIVARNSKRKKKAVVAGMRRLAVRMWHVAQTTTEVEIQKITA